MRNKTKNEFPLAQLNPPPCTQEEEGPAHDVLLSPGVLSGEELAGGPGRGGHERLPLLDHPRHAHPQALGHHLLQKKDSNG